MSKIRSKVVVGNPKYRRKFYIRLIEFGNSKILDLLNTIYFFHQASLKCEALITLASLVTDQTFSKGEMIVKASSKTTPALYLVRQGAIEVKPTSPNQEVQMVWAGGYFGEELLRTGRAKSNVMVNATVMAEVMEEPCVCGMLTLSDCHTMFDTDLFAPLAKACISSEVGKWKQSGLLNLSKPIPYLHFYPK